MISLIFRWFLITFDCFGWLYDDFHCFFGDFWWFSLIFLMIFIDFSMITDDFWLFWMINWWFSLIFRWFSLFFLMNLVVFIDYSMIFWWLWLFRKINWWFSLICRWFSLFFRWFSLIFVDFSIFWSSFDDFQLSFFQHRETHRYLLINFPSSPLDSDDSDDYSMIFATLCSFYENQTKKKKKRKKEGKSKKKVIERACRWYLFQAIMNIKCLKINYIIKNINFSLKIE